MILESNFPLKVTEQDGKFIADFNDAADGENIPQDKITASGSDGRTIALDSYSYVYDENASAVFKET